MQSERERGRERLPERQREIETEIGSYIQERSLLLTGSLPEWLQQPGLGPATRNQELLLGLVDEYRAPSTWAIFYSFYRYTLEELD